MEVKYVKPKSKEEFYTLISMKRGIKQTFLPVFDEVYEKSTSNMLELVCKSKPFGIKTSLSIVRLGKKKQKKFLKWYLKGQKVKNIDDTYKYVKYPVKFVHSWVAQQKEK